MAYDFQSYKTPFWAKSSKYVRGRDPLGIQNSSISVYAALLPGMTNLTLRLRYYGFYLWLLDEYHKFPADNLFKSSVTYHYNFIRRGELILSYLMTNKAPDELSIIGSDFTSKHKDEISEKGFYDIVQGADKLESTKKGSVYWDYTSGALGQYYAGSLLNLGLIDSKSRYFERTEGKGTELAQAYRVSLDPDAAALFLSRVQEGKLFAGDLEVFMDFAINKPLKGTPEGDYYERLLLAPDKEEKELETSKPPEQRKESLHLFLSYMSAAEDEKDFKQLPVTLYASQLNNEKLNEAHFGWYFYYLNEQLHYSLEGIFWGLLELMQERTFTVQEFLGFVRAQCLSNEELASIGELEDLSGAITHLMDSDELVSDHIEAITLAVKQNQEVVSIAHGIKALLCLYRDNAHHLADLEKYAIAHDLRSKYGNALEIFDMYVIQNKKLAMGDFVHRLVHTLLNEHIAIAYNKMGNGEKNLLKFVIEDNLLIHVETMEPNFTNPRLRTLFNFSVDLGYLDNDGSLTEDGAAIMELTRVA